MVPQSKKNIKKQRLGEILKSLNLLDDSQLEEILEKQKESKLRLGEVLTQMGYVDKEILLSLIGKQLGHPYIKVSEYGHIPGELTRLIPRSIAEKHMLVPFEKKGETLLIAMTDPQESEICSAISILTGFEVEPYITSDEEIKKALENNY